MSCLFLMYFMKALVQVSSSCQFVLASFSMLLHISVNIHIYCTYNTKIEKTHISILYILHKCSTFSAREFVPPMSFTMAFARHGILLQRYEIYCGLELLMSHCEAKRRSRPAETSGHFEVIQTFAIGRLFAQLEAQRPHLRL